MDAVYKYGKGILKDINLGNELIWCIGNGIGGYSNHTAAGGASMLYHGYLVASLNPPVNRYLLFTRTQEEIEVNNKRYDLTSQQYINYNKEGNKYLEQFNFNIIPEYRYRVNDIIFKKRISMDYGKNTVAVTYEIRNGKDESNFKITPLFNYRLSGESMEKSKLKFNKNLQNNLLTLIPKENKNLKIKFFASSGEFYDRENNEVTMATPNYLIDENNYLMIDNRTGFLGLDNHYTPYEVNVKMKPYETKKLYLICTIEEDIKNGFEIEQEYIKRTEKLVELSEVKDNLSKNLVKAADHFIVNRNSTKLKTVLAGLPWFTDWGRDTMIAFEGLLLSTRRFEEAREVLESFALYVKDGLVPNMFPDEDLEPLYNTVDASLWYFQAVYKYLKYTGSDKDYEYVYKKIYKYLVEIFKAYSTKTKFSIEMDEDGLIRSGSGLDQVTWMDVRVGSLVVTPRHGKAVEINALWYNALCILEELRVRFNEENLGLNELKIKVKESFNEKFWNEEKECLFDVVDENDDKIRPNQINAVYLPFTMLSRDREKKIVDIVHKHLYSSYGLRSLSYEDDDFKKEYVGKLIDRDLAYHMGTTWGYLIGGFISAYIKVNDYTNEALEVAKDMIELFEDHMKDGCINGIAEIFDGEFSNTSRGCYTQAWSVSEVLRVNLEIQKYM